MSFSKIINNELRELDYRDDDSNIPGVIIIPGVILQIISNGIDVRGLQILTLSKCCLAELSSGLHNLDTLNIRECPNFTTLPKFDSTWKLKTLYIVECESLLSLPMDLGYLESLSIMHISKCSNLTGIPDCFTNMNLRILSFYSCNKIQNLPPSIGDLTSLCILKISFCAQIDRIPLQFGKLKDFHIDFDKPRVYHQLHKHKLFWKKLRWSYSNHKDVNNKFHQFIICILLSCARLRTCNIIVPYEMLIKIFEHFYPWEHIC